MVINFLRQSIVKKNRFFWLASQVIVYISFLSTSKKLPKYVEKTGLFIMSICLLISDSVCCFLSDNKLLANILSDFPAVWEVDNFRELYVTPESFITAFYSRTVTVFSSDASISLIYTNIHYIVSYFELASRLTTV